MGLGAVLVLSLSLPAFAADKAGKGETDNILMREVSIIGSKSRIKDIAGSAAFLDVQDIREQNVEDINRILRRVPGVNLREETGYGLFPNISLRGVDPARSSKVTIMEDGILMAPAPYSAPSAYYTPNTGRMSGIEILKGSSQVKYGPHTTGGAINFLSTPIPTTSKAYLKSTFGYFNELRTHTYFGTTEQLEGGGKAGYVIEYYMRNTTGFREQDTTAPDMRGEPNTGFTRQEPMLKLFWEPKSSLYQRIEAKFGFTNLDANVTYTGLRNEDFAANPFRRYNAARFDEIESTQYRSYIRHLIELNSSTSMVTTLYGNTFNRNWQKLNEVGTSGDFGKNSGTNLSEAMAQKSMASYQCLTGTAACNFVVKNNNRTYHSYGAQVDLTHKLVAGAIKHELNLNVRHHYDQIRRKQWQEEYTQNAQGAITAVQVSARGEAGNRLQRTEATAVNLSDKMKIGKLTFTPGVRTETIRQNYCDDNTNCATATKEGQRTYTVVVGGGSVKYDAIDAAGKDLDFFGGIHRGFSPASPRSNIKSGVVHETSVGMEVGARYSDAPKAFSTEAVLFMTTIDNLVTPDSIGGSGASVGENAGKVRTMGLELSARYDPGLRHGWAAQTPMYFATTLTDAEFRSDVTSTDQETIWAAAKKGNQLPYIPEFQIAFGAGVIYKKVSASLDASYVSEAYADGGNTGTSAATDGDPNERFGKIDSRLVVDASFGYQFNNSVRLFSNIKNLTNQEYIVSRQPHGPRPGLPLTVMAGLEVSL